MGYFDNLNSTNVFRESKPFGALNSIKWRANAILRDRTKEEIEHAASQIESAISTFKEEEIEREIERHAYRLLRVGGWELQYLEDSSHRHEPTLSEIYDLLQNWPRWAPDKPDIPKEADISDFDALRELMDTDQYYVMGFNVILPPHELYAVLALLTIEGAARLTRVNEKRTEHGSWIHPGPFPWDKDSIILAGNLIIEAMAIICWAERSVATEKLSEMRDEQKKNIVEQARLDERKSASKHAINTKNAPHRRAEEFVREEWSKNKAEYNNNKASFARDFVPIVANKFKNNKGDPLKITEKQMREVWLSDTPPTRKPARQRVGG
jgi:hypothetical protein